MFSFGKTLDVVFFKNPPAPTDQGSPPPEDLAGWAEQNEIRRYLGLFCAEPAGLGGWGAGCLDVGWGRVVRF